LASESDYGTVGRIDSIAGAVAPEEVEAGIQLDPRHQLCGQRGMDVEEVARAECGFVAKVVATRVEGIEGAEAVVVGILVAAGYGDEQGQPRSASDLAERIAGVSRKRPGADAGVAKAATGSPPFSRTLTRRPIESMRSVHVEAKEVQCRVQAWRG